MISAVYSPPAATTSTTQLVVTQLRRSLVLLVGVAVGAVHRLDVLAQRARVRVALVTAANLAHVRLLHTHTHTASQPLDLAKVDLTYTLCVIWRTHLFDSFQLDFRTFLFSAY